MPLLLLMAVSLSLTSCLKNQEDYFDEPASQRLQSTINRVRQILTSSTYGWELEYYPSSTLAYGGIVYTVKFDSLQATVGCSLVPDSTETTYYRITNDNGPVLTFDTYNSLLHYFSTPSAGEYQAKGGEFELVINEISDDLITLYGKKTRNTMYLRRLTSSPEEYARETIHIFDNFVQSFHGNIGTAETRGIFHPGNKSIEVIHDGDTIISHYTYNNRGIRLYSPLRLGGATVQTFAFDTESLLLTCLDEGYEDIQLQGVPFPDDIMHFADYEGTYTLRYENNANTATMRLVPNRLEGTYIIRDLSRKGEIVASFDYDTGDLSFGPQVIGASSGRTIYFVTYDTETSSIWLAEDATLSIKWNKQRIYSVYNITATLPDTYPCNSGLFIMIITNADGSLSAELVDDGDLLVNNSASLQNITSMIKVRN